MRFYYMLLTFMRSMAIIMMWCCYYRIHLLSVRQNKLRMH